RLDVLQLAVNLVCRRVGVVRIGSAASDRHAQAKGEYPNRPERNSATEAGRQTKGKPRRRGAGYRRGVGVIEMDGLHGVVRVAYNQVDELLRPGTTDQHGVGRCGADDLM